LKVILCVLGLVASVTGAWAQVETYRLDWSNVGGGGQTFATGGPYRLGGSTGQADARVFSGGVYTLQGGFWQSRTAPVLDASSDDPVPLAFAARPPMPNPFRDQTTLRFDLPSSARVDLTLLSVDGRVVRHLLQAERGAGRHQAIWDGRDDQKRAVPPGIYFVRLRAGTFAATHRIVHLD